MFAGEVVNRAEPMFQLCQALRIQIEPFDDATRAVGRLADLGEGGFGDVERLAKSLMQRRQPVEQTLRAAELVVGTVLAAVQQLLRLRTFFKQAARMCELAMRSEEHTSELQSLM